MKVLKFGGSSLATADKISRVTEIVKDESANSEVSVVVSAPGGVTNQLVTIVDKLTQKKNISEELNELENHITNIAGLTEDKFENFRNAVRNASFFCKVPLFPILGYIHRKWRHSSFYIAIREEIRIVILS